MENKAKILLLGKTGVGKSSFINYFLGKTVAKAATGKPVTQDYFIPYEIEEGRYPIQIFDTKGLEAMGANDQLNEIINGIKQKNNSENVFDWFHTIFYCVSMSNPRFEDFEANFISRLQQKLTQHIHIIITHCDAATPESIANMRRTIIEKLGNNKNIEIFEVVCVSKRKRNGKIVEPRGKEKISERVFDLLLEDISCKLSSDYANTLWSSLKEMIDRAFSDLDDYVDETVKLGTLFHLLTDTDEMTKRLDSRWEVVTTKIDKNIKIIQNQTDEKFTAILRPVAQLYTSYRGIATDSYVKDAELSCSDALEWLDTSWYDETFDDTKLREKILPGFSRHTDENGEFSGEESLFGLFSFVGAFTGDLLKLKKNIKKILQEMRWNYIYQSIPSRDEIQAKVSKQIVRYIKPDALLAHNEPQAISKS